MKLTFSKLALPRSGAAIVLALDGAKLTHTGVQLDRQLDGALERAMQANSFKGRKGHMVEVIAPSGLLGSRVIIVGVGKPSDLTAVNLESMGGKLHDRLNASREKDGVIAVDPIKGCKVKPAEVAAHIAFGAQLSSYRFDKYRTTLKDDEKPSLENFQIQSRGPAAARKAYVPLAAIASGVFLARDLMNEPPNHLHPASFAQRARSLSKLGVKVEVLGKAQMKKLGMGALLGVAQGSVREPKLVVMQWKGAAKASDHPLVFVGKGVTFDSGGISIKPSPGMGEMKGDMGGAAAVTGLMDTVARRKAKANIIGIIGLVENMPDADAQRPSDIVTSYSGQTIEVLNTDAEGRLVLADALWYAQKRFKPRFMIDLATLTGAILVALGEEYAGIFASDDKLAEQLSKAGDAEDEKVWRLPLSEAYDRTLKSKFADMQNISPGRHAGSITAAQFIKRFTNDVPWVHIDIAGTAWQSKKKPTSPSWATGYGVRLLNRMIADNYERKR